MSPRHGRSLAKRTNDVSQRGAQDSLVISMTGGLNLSY